MRLLLTLNVGKLWYAEHTIPFMRRYADRVGADFLELRRPSGREACGRSPAWERIEAIHFLASQSRYTSLLLIDADVLIMPKCPDIFDQSEGRIAVVQDMGLPQVDDAFRRWCLKHFNTSPKNGPYFNAGVLVIARDAARACSSLFRGPYPNEWPFEQSYLNLWLPRIEKLKWLPCAFNWLAPQFRQRSLEQHIVHFVGRHKHLLPSFAEQVRRM